MSSVNNPVLKQLIEQHCSGMTVYQEIANRLNAHTTIDDPLAGQTDTITDTTTEPITLKQVMAIVPSSERNKIRKQLPGFTDDVRRAIDTTDAEYMASLIEDAFTDGAISAETVQALTVLLQSDRTVTTTTEIVRPTTTTGPSLATLAGLPHITAAMVQGAMN